MDLLGLKIEVILLLGSKSVSRPLVAMTFCGLLALLYRSLKVRQITNNLSMLPKSKRVTYKNSLFDYKHTLYICWLFGNIIQA
jgi:hypothetical protein